MVPSRQFQCWLIIYCVVIYAINQNIVAFYCTYTVQSRPFCTHVSEEILITKCCPLMSENPDYYLRQYIN